MVRAIGSRRRSSAQAPWLLAQIPILGRATLATTCCESTPIRAVALAMEAGTAEKEPPLALLAPDRPDTNRQVPLEAERGIGPSLDDVRRQLRRTRPVNDTGGSEFRPPAPTSRHPLRLPADHHFSHFQAAGGHLCRPRGGVSNRRLHRSTRRGSVAGPPANTALAQGPRRAEARARSIRQTPPARRGSPPARSACLRRQSCAGVAACACPWLSSA